MNHRLLIFLLLILVLVFGFYVWAYAQIYRNIGQGAFEYLFKPNNTFTVGDPTALPGKKYVALGDSLSFGVSLTDIKDTFAYSYASKLATKEKAITGVVLAWPGDESEEVLKNQLPQAIQQNPDYVSLFIGINDIHEKRSLEHFRSNYQDILTQLLANTHAQILVINLPYLGSSESIIFPLNYLLNFRTRQFNNVITELVANKSRIKMVDLYSKSNLVVGANPAYYSADKFHPNAAGYKAWSEIINNAN